MLLITSLLLVFNERFDLCRSLNKGKTRMSTPISSYTVVILLLYSALLPAQENQPEGIAPRVLGEIERLDPAIDKLIAPDAQIEAVADGFKWSEGPVWLAEKQCVIFSDVPTNTVYSWSEKEGLAIYLKPSGFTGLVTVASESGSNGLAVDKQGRLILCQHGDRRLALMNSSQQEPKSNFVTLADRYDGKRFNSPNDLAIHSNGTIFFTDPPYGLAKQLEDPSRELNFQGVYKVNPAEENPTVRLLIKDLPRPNGIALSPNEKKLYVAQSHRTAKIIMSYDLNEQLEIASGNLFFDANELGKIMQGNPDGLKIDREGNLFATGPGGVLVISPKGKHLGTIMTGERISNCAFGDDGKTLYMTSDRYLCRIRLKTAGY